MGRAPCCDKASVKRGPWSPEEDDLLRSYVHNHGTGGNWIALPHKAGLNRCGKSCRLRWLNYLRPDIKHGGYTEQEDRVICSLYSSIGSRWSVIASKLPGRTDNDVKNYWNTKLKKKALAVVQQQQQEYYAPHHQGDDRRAFFAATPPPPTAQQSQQCASMHPSPASASSVVTTASGGDVACSFGAMYNPSPPAPARYVDDDGGAVPAPPTTQHAAPSSSFAELLFPRPAPPTTGGVTNSCWATTGAGTALEDMFLPELLGAAGEFPPGGADLFSGGFGTLLLQDPRASPSSLQDLAACYFPNAQAELWADVKPPSGLCRSFT